MRMLRALRGDSLDYVGETLGYKKSTLSTVERYPEQAGKKLRRALSDYYGCTWVQLCKPVEGSAVAAALCKSLKSERRPNV